MTRKVKKATTGGSSTDSKDEPKKITLKPTVIKKVDDKTKEQVKKVVKAAKKNEGQDCVTSNDCAGKFSCLPVEDRKGTQSLKCVVRGRYGC